MNKLNLTLCFGLAILFLSSCERPDYTDEIHDIWFVSQNSENKYDSDNGDTQNDTDPTDFGDTTDADEVSDSEQNDSETADSEVTDGEVEVPDQPENPAELVYPEVTSKSNEIGDVAQNVTIYDDLDVEHKLAEWYKENNPSSKLIWLIFTTYDCTPCHLLREDLLEINKPEYRKDGLKILLVFNGLLDGPQPELEPERLSNYKQILLSEYPESAKFELYGYLRMEEQKVLHKFFSNPLGGTYPTWMFIDSSTMEIVEYDEGWGYDMVNSTCSEIEMLLEQL